MGRQAKGSRHGSVKLTQENILEIREMLSRGIRQKVIAKQFGVTQQSIAYIKSGRNWRHVGRNGPPPANQPMGHIPPPPPARRAVAQSSRATGQNVSIAQAALQLSQSSGISTAEAMDMIERATRIPATASQMETIGRRLNEAVKQHPSNDLSKPRKRKVTLE